MNICSLAHISGFFTWHSHKHFKLLQSNALVSLNAHKEFAIYNKNGEFYGKGVENGPIWVMLSNVKFDTLIFKILLLKAL